MWVFIGIAIVVVLVLVLLSIPLDLRLKMDTRRKPVISLRVRWLFGLVRVAPGARKRQRPDKPRQADQKQGGVRHVFSATGLLRSGGLAKESLRLGRRLLSRIQSREEEARLRIVLSDPADMGALFSVLGPLTVLTNLCTPVNFYAEPVLSDDIRASGSAQGTLRIKPIALVPPLLGFIFSGAFLRALPKLIKQRIHAK